MERAQLHRGIVTLSALALTCPVWACSGVGPRGQPVVFGDQTNIVIWDKDHQTEHFIRNASFKSGADDFGFIAPTPGKPQLEEASSQAFVTLASLRPVIRYATRSGAGRGAAMAKSRSDEVRVIQEADVSGYHATTLFARSAVAINDWMNEHGYVSTPEVEEWAERYCKRGWYLTAFKVTDKTKLAASTGTIRMSFKTHRPYNPFYVPASNISPTKKGTLMVYFVANGDYDAHIGPKGDTWTTPQWTASIPWDKSDKLATEAKLKSEDIPARAQVETFVDPNFPRPAPDDIYFERSNRLPTPQPVPRGGIPAGGSPGGGFPGGSASVLAGASLLAVAFKKRTA